MKEKLIILKEVSNPLISVIIPTLNEEKYIEKTLLSVKAQTFKKSYEIIVSDGKSKDNTVEIAKKYANKIVICNKKGISLGRNLGAKHAKGKFLVFVDADTLLLPNGLEEIFKEVKKKNVALVSCPVIPSSYSPLNYFLYSLYNYSAKQSIKMGKPKIAGMIMATKKELFWQVNGFNEKMKTCEGLDFSERISKLGKVKITEKTFAISSDRRIKKWGKFKSIFKYFCLYFGYLLTKKDIGASTYEPIR